MMLTRALRLSLARSERSTFSFPDAKLMRVLELELSLEVEETMVMIAAIFMALSANSVLCTKSFTEDDNLLPRPRKSTLRTRDKEVSIAPTGLTRAKTLSWESDATELIGEKVRWELEGVMVLVLWIFG